MTIIALSYIAGLLLPKKFEVLSVGFILTITMVWMFLAVYKQNFISNNIPRRLEIDRPYLITSLLLFAVTRLEDYRYPFNWDDYSHWIRMFRAFLIHGLEFETIIQFSQFPPYGSIYPYFLSTLTYDSTSFEDVYFLFILIFLTLYIGYIRLFPKNRPLFVLLTVICFNASTPANHNLQADNIIPLTSALFIWSFMSGYSIRAHMITASYALFVIFTKPTGVAFIMISTGLGLLIKFRQRKCFIKIIPVIIALIIYAVYLISVGSLQNGVRTIPSLTLLESLKSQVVTMSGLLNQSILVPIATNNISKVFISTLLIFYLTFELSISRHWRLAIGFSLAYVGFILALSVGYNTYVDHSNGIFHSLDRYVYSYSLFVLFLFLLLASRLNILSIRLVLIILILQLYYFLPGASTMYLAMSTLLACLICRANKLRSFDFNNFPDLKFTAVLVVSVVSIYLALQVQFVKGKLFSGEEQILNARALELYEISIRSGRSAGTIFICNPTGYDALAVAFRSLFTEGIDAVSIRSDKCGVPKYQLPD